MDFLSNAEDLIVRNVALLSLLFLLRKHNLGCSILQRLVRQLACTDFVHSRGRSSLMLVSLVGANHVKDCNADAIQRSKEVVGRIYISTLFPVRGADLTQKAQQAPSSSCGTMDFPKYLKVTIIGVLKQRTESIFQGIWNLEQWDGCIEHQSTPSLSGWGGNTKWRQAPHYRGLYIKRRRPRPGNAPVSPS